MSEQAPKRPKRPRDPNQLAKSIVAEATGESSKTGSDTQPTKDPAAVSLGRRGGLKGGIARSQRLGADEKREIAKKAAAARWGKNKK
jgi:hypothetical protein